MNIKLRRVALVAVLLIAFGQQAALAQVNPISYQALEASSAKAATSAGNTPSFVVFDQAASLELDVTAAATDVGDTLDVFVQCSMDGTSYVDVCHFTQVLGNGGAKRFYAKINATEPQAMFDNSVALAAGSVRHIFSSKWRVRWVIVDAGTVNASFTFSVWASGGRVGTGL